MRILGSLVAIVAGFGFLMFSGFVAGGLVSLAAKLAVTALGAWIAGWMTARLAPFSPLGHTLVLALLVGAASLSVIRTGSPAGWYPRAAAAAAVLGVLAGGWIRAAAGATRGTVGNRS